MRIPREHQEFIDLSKDSWGINERTKAFLLEYNHPYANAAFVAGELRRIALGDIWFYSALDQAPEALAFILDIFKALLFVESYQAQQHTLLQTLLEFTGAMAEADPLPQQTLCAALDLIAEVIHKPASGFIPLSDYVKSFLNPVAAIPGCSAQVLDLSRTVADKTVEFWRSCSPLASWYAGNQTVMAHDYSKIIADLGTSFFAETQLKLSRCRHWDELKAIPWGFNEIADIYYRFGDNLSLPLERFNYMIYLLQHPGMQNLKIRIINDLKNLLAAAAMQLQEAEFGALIEKIFNLFEELRGEYLDTLLDVISVLGKGIMDTHDKKTISLFENKLIKFGFCPPGITYISSDWQIQRNPCHLKNLKIWLELIEYAPNQMRKLLSALIVNLSLGKVMIFDTDLFQRDLTKLLNAEIAPIFSQIKLLTRLFPVFFNAICAEGELREVTTAIDELSNRQDILIHFLRKQIHMEGNSIHIELVRRILDFWHDGDKTILQDMVPEEIYAAIDTAGPWFSSIHALVQAVCLPLNRQIERLLLLDTAAVDNLLQETPEADSLEGKRLKHLLKLHSLLQEKYSMDAIDIISTLKNHHCLDTAAVDNLKLMLEHNREEEAVAQIYEFITQLNRIILDPTPSEGWENIYYKRHIAFGIPSMYGEYHEKKFEALGLTFRLEKFATRLLENIINGLNLNYITGKTLRRIYRILDLMRQGLELNGIYNQGLKSNLKMFNYSLSSGSFSLNQYIDIFQFTEENIREIINNYFFRLYDQPLKVIIPHFFPLPSTSSDKESSQFIHKKSEEFYREMLSSAFVVQTLDNFIGKVLYTLRHMVDNFPEEHIRNIMSYDSDTIISPLYKETLEMDNPVFLGSKAYALKNLYLKGFPVPPGFVLTTEIFRRHHVISAHPHLYMELDNLILIHLEELERLTGKKYGDPVNPLLLSVRSGTAISMPGAMNTFLNVGVNDEIIKNLSRQPNFGWTAWDCYRRFLQSWGMVHGIDRDEFDEVIIKFKELHGVEQKIQFTPAQMQEIAYAYKKVLHHHNVHFEDDPFSQLKQAIIYILDSWDSERAKVYRKKLQIADEWGTAVLVQAMVLGNIHYTSGTGVVFTHDPNTPKPGIRLYGDFTLCSQGEDIVAGLVHVLPISEAQRQRLRDDPGISLEMDFPNIYNKIWDLASDLTENQGYSHQEIEFTFESEHPKDFYILQIREQNIRTQDKILVFSSNPEDMELVGRGIGIGGAVLNGIVAFNLQDLKTLRLQYPEHKLILVRPDTVPDDIGMIFECDGLITGRGGATSHAAVTAARLGRICVVNCVDLQISPGNKSCKFKNHLFGLGDPIALDAHQGNIYRGNYPIEFTPASYENAATQIKI